VPAIGTRHGGIPDIIDDGVTGFLVPERDPVSLGDRLATLLGSRDLRKRQWAPPAGEDGARVTTSRSIGRLEEIYDTVIARFRKPITA